jgi:hypothetical protein
LVASFQEDTILDYCICDALNTTKILMELSRHIAAGDTDHTRVHPTPAFIRDEFDSMIRTIIGTRMAEGSKATELMEFWQRYRAMPQPPE